MLITEAFTAYRQEYILLRQLSPRTEDNYIQAMRSLLKVIADKPVVELSLDDVRTWQQAMDHQGCTPGTIRGYLSRIKNVLLYTNRKNLTSFDTSQLIMPKEPRRLPKFLNIQEIKAMLKACESPRETAIVSLLFSSGIRCSELCNLNRRDLQGNKLFINGKGNRERQAVLDDRTLGRLLKYLATRTDIQQPMFITQKHCRMAKETLERLVRDTAAAAGIQKPVTPHWLRHSHATDLMINGANLRYIQRSLGHAYISTTELYLHVLDKDFERVMTQYHTVV